jgi:hypothetical protein
MLNTNPTGKGGFIQGESGNPNGRPVGARNRRTKEIIEQIIKSGNKDPLVTLSELQANSQDESIRASAANMLAPFLHSKLTATPAPRFVETEITLPSLDSLEHAVESIALIESAVAENRLDVQSAQDLIGMINAYIAGKNIMEIAELQERLANIEQSIAASPASSQTVHVQGRMPALPGTNITMPGRNGNEVRQLQTHSSALGEPSVSFEEREHAPVVHEDLPKSTTIEATAGEPPPNEAE